MKTFFLSRARAAAFGALLTPAQEPTLSDLGIGYVIDCGLCMDRLPSDCEEDQTTALDALRSIVESCKEGPYAPFAHYFELIADVAEKANLRPELRQRHVCMFFALLSDREDEPQPPGTVPLPSRAAVCSAIGYLALRELRQKYPPREALVQELLGACYLMQQIMEAAQAEAMQLPVIVRNPKTGACFERVGTIDRPMLQEEAERLVQRARSLAGLIANMTLDLRYVLSRAPLVFGWEPAMVQLPAPSQELSIEVEVGTRRDGGEAAGGG